MIIPAGVDCGSASVPEVACISIVVVKLVLPFPDIPGMLAMSGMPPIPSLICALAAEIMRKKNRTDIETNFATNHLSLI
jgi:hypothetical protein